MDKSGNSVRLEERANAQTPVLTVRPSERSLGLSASTETTGDLRTVRFRRVETRNGRLTWWSGGKQRENLEVTCGKQFSQLRFGETRRFCYYSELILRFDSVTLNDKYNPFYIVKSGHKKSGM